MQLGHLGLHSGCGCRERTDESRVQWSLKSRWVFNSWTCGCQSSFDLRRSPTVLSVLNVANSLPPSEVRIWMDVVGFDRSTSAGLASGAAVASGVITLSA